MKIMGLGIPELTIMLLPVLCIGAICCAISIWLGKKKGYSSGLCGVLGFFLGVIGLIVVAILPDKSAEKASTEMQNADSLIKYKQLLDQGVITQEEFESKKRELLNPRSN